MVIYLFRKLLWGSGLGLLLLGYGVLVEPEQLKLREVEFVSDKYTGPDIRIGLVTDIHINSLAVPPSKVLKIAKVLNSQNPDMVLLTGDFIAGHEAREYRSDTFNRRIRSGIKNLESIEAPAFAAIGNHDAWWDAEHVDTLLEGAGVTVLENEAQQVDQICLVGLADAMTSQPNSSAYDACDKGIAPLVLTHSPDAWQTFRGDTVLALAGHTHGGQVNLPIIGRRVNAISLGSEHSYGFSEIAGVDMFVSAGVGTSMLPIRFRAPPEIVIITLRAR
jgi:predicted MPP superfamily phosphohydrolase